MNILKFTKALTTASLLVFTLPFYASEEGCPCSASKEETSTEQHVQIDSRPVDPTTKEEAELLRTEEAEQAIAEIDSQLASIETVSPESRTEETSPELVGVTGDYFTPNLYHWLKDFRPNTLVLEDGSEWAFGHHDTYLVRSWRPGDTLVISPNSYWLFKPDYSYIITNKSQGTSVEVNPSLGPVEYGQESVWVRGIDRANNRVYLINGRGQASTWVISNTPADQLLFKDWKVNDHIILAENSDWVFWFSPLDHVLINVDMNHFVRAKQL